MQHTLKIIIYQTYQTSTADNLRLFISKLIGINTHSKYRMYYYFQRKLTFWSAGVLHDPTELWGLQALKMGISILSLLFYPL